MTPSASTSGLLSGTPVSEGRLSPRVPSVPGAIFASFMTQAALKPGPETPRIVPPDTTSGQDPLDPRPSTPAGLGRQTQPRAKTLARELKAPPPTPHTARTKIQKPARFPVGSPIGSPPLAASRRPGSERRFLPPGFSFPPPRLVTNWRERRIPVRLAGRTWTALPPGFPDCPSPWIHYAPRPGRRGLFGSPPTLLHPRTPTRSRLSLPPRQGPLRQS